MQMHSMCELGAQRAHVTFLLWMLAIPYPDGNPYHALSRWQPLLDHNDILQSSMNAEQV